MPNFTELTIGLGERSYPIYITADYDSIGECLKKAGIKGNIVVITDSNVGKFQMPAFIRALEYSVIQRSMLLSRENRQES